jgi:hypothetical protein
LSDNSLGDADYYNPNDYIGFGTRLLIILVDSFVLLLIGIALWLPFAALSMTGAVRSDPSGYFWLL